MNMRGSPYNIKNNKLHMKTRYLLIVFFTCFLYSSNLWGQWQGSGTAEAPFQIKLDSDLEQLSILVNRGVSYEGKYFSLMNDIDLSSYQEGDGWIPIGNLIDSKTKNPFKGSFNGHGYTIHRLNINRPEGKCQGLFGYAEGARIDSVIMSEVTIKAKDYVGSLIGYIRDGSIDGCQAEAGITARKLAGALIGCAFGGTVTHCAGSGSIDGLTILGGLVGYLSGGAQLSHGSAETKISGQDNIGGLIGRLYGSSVRYSQATGSVNGQNDVGGLVGGQYDASSSIRYAYSSGSVYGTERATGGLVGYQHKGSVDNAYAAGKTSGNDAVGGLVGFQFFGQTAYCYTSGSVSGGQAVGGLTGYQYYEGIKLSNGLAANPGINSGSQVGAVVGRSVEEVINCYTLDGIEISGTPGESSLNGGKESLATVQSPAFYTSVSNWAGQSWLLQDTYDESKTNEWNIWAGRSFPYFQHQAAPVADLNYSGTQISGIYRMNDSQTTNKIMLYVNGAYRADATLDNGNWRASLSVAEGDTITAIVYEKGHIPSYPVSLTVSASSLIKKTGTANTVKLYPNPVNNTLFIQISDGRIPEIKIYNPHGSLCHHTSLKSIDFSSFSSGIYIVDVNGEKYKLVKE